MGFKENLKSEITFQNIQVKELSSKSGVKKDTIDKYLYKGQLPNVKIGVKIAQALGVSVEYLVTGNETPKDVIGSLSRTSMHIGQYAEKLDTEKREFVFEFIKWLLLYEEKSKDGEQKI